MSGHLVINTGQASDNDNKEVGFQLLLESNFTKTSFPPRIGIRGKLRRESIKAIILVIAKHPLKILIDSVLLKEYNYLPVLRIAEKEGKLLWKAYTNSSS